MSAIYQQVSRDLVNTVYKNGIDACNLFQKYNLFHDTDLHNIRPTCVGDKVTMRTIPSTYKNQQNLPTCFSDFLDYSRLYRNKDANPTNAQ